MNTLIGNQVEKFCFSSIRILRLFANILKPDEVLSLSKGECLTQPFQMQLSQNQKIFSETFAGFPEFK